jgi:site-specific DNA recombinase
LSLRNRRAARDGLAVIGTYEDRALSGASLHGRQGLAALMQDAADRRLDVVIVEELERLARDEEDLPAIYKRLTFHGVDIVTVHEGKADRLRVGIRAVIGAMYLNDLQHKVRRGMAGVVRSGRHAGGRAYGYRPVPGKPGELAILEPEAAVVRRIFSEYVAGRTPREIAAALNRDRVPPPRGTRWNASTINGNRSRGHGMLLNEIYAGRIVWNKVRMIKDPDTGKRVSRPNPADQHQAIDVPELRIVDEETFRIAQAIKQSHGQHPAHHARKPARLLSGLLKCGCCGGGMPARNRDRYGRMRVQCAAVSESGTCDNHRTFYLDAIEDKVIKGLRTQLDRPELLAAYVKTYNAERRRLAAAAVADRGKMERRLAEVKRGLKRLAQAIAEGRDSEQLGEEMAELAAERDRLREQLAATPEAPQVIALHPTAIESYQATIERLRDRLGAPDAITEFRKLVAAVTVHPHGPRGFELEIKGRLAELTGSDAFPKVCRGSLVAEEGLEPPTHGL